MGPNLTRLFEYKKLDGLRRDLAYCGTYAQRKDLFDRHGEALIVALEQVTAELEQHQPFKGKYHASVGQAQQLLAQLEAEAGL